MGRQADCDFRAVLACVGGREGSNTDDASGRVNEAEMSVRRLTEKGG